WGRRLEPPAHRWNTIARHQRGPAGPDLLPAPANLEEPVQERRLAELPAVQESRGLHQLRLQPQVVPAISYPTVLIEQRADRRYLRARDAPRSPSRLTSQQCSPWFRTN